MRTSESSSVLISVIICTYNRSDLLAGALKTLCCQTTVDKSEYEIIVVDNNSTDETLEVVQGFSGVTYYLETKQGLSYARNRGWQEAKGRYIAYIDDDCEVPETWLAAVKDTIERIASGVFGGPTYAFYNSPKPVWYKDSYGSYEPVKKPRILRGEECTYIKGNNMCFRRTLLEAIGGFDVTLGMSGEKLGYHEDTDLILRIAVAFPNEVIYYHPDLYLYHLVREEKMNLLWYFRAWFAIGQYSVSSSNVSRANAAHQLGKQILSHLLSIIKYFARGLLFRDHIRYPYFQNYLYERGFVYFKELGQMVGKYQQMKGRY